MSFAAKFLRPLSNPRPCDDNLIEPNTLPDKPSSTEEDRSENAAFISTQVQPGSDIISDNVSKIADEPEQPATNVVPFETIPEYIPANTTFDVEANVKKSEKVTIESFFAQQGFSIDFSTAKDRIPPAIHELAANIALNFNIAGAFIRFIRESITKKKFDVIYYMDTITPTERNATVELANELCDYCILYDVFYNKHSNTLHLGISTAPRITNFINGDCMEIYAQTVTLDTIKEVAAKYGCDYELYTNVHITQNDKANELDLVFRLGDKIFWGEIKSGSVNADKYRILGERIGLIPDRLLLLIAEKTDKQNEAISYLYKCFVTNVDSYKCQLNNMLTKAFEEENG